jgi:hypothetical protein
MFAFRVDVHGRRWGLSVPALYAVRVRDSVKHDTGARLYDAKAAVASHSDPTLV